MKPVSSLALAVVFLLSSCGLCSVKRAPERFQKGHLYVVPTWQKSEAYDSFAIYMRWKEEYPEGHAEFEERMETASVDAFGDRFPRVDFGDQSLPLELSLLDREDVDDLIQDLKAWAEKDPEYLRLYRAATDVGRRVEDTLENETEYLTIFQGNEAQVKEVTYIDKGDVTYCVYGAFVFRKAEESDEGEGDEGKEEHDEAEDDEDEDEPWVVSVTRDLGNGSEEVVTARLDLYVIVKEFDD